MNRITCRLAIFLITAFPLMLHAQPTITFEPDAGGFFPDGSAVVDDMEIYDQFLSYGVRFGLDANMDGVLDDGVYPVLEETGGGGISGGLGSSTGFNSTTVGIEDVAAPGFEDQLGSFFLRSPTSSRSSPLLIVYVAPVKEASGEIWDIDAWQGRTEQWRVEALDARGNVITSILSPEGTNLALDSKPWSFTIQAGRATGIKALRLVFVGTKQGAGVGVAFNNFSPSGLLPADDLQILPAVEIRWNSEPGTVYQVQWKANRRDPWQNLGATLTGTGGVLFTFDSHHDPRRTYRLVTVN